MTSIDQLLDGLESWASPPMTVYISIGNSDDKLSQRQWSQFVGTVHDALAAVVARGRATLHGSWRSPSDAPWQNACWCFEASADVMEPLRELLSELAGIYRQDSVAWAVAATEFLGASNG